MSETVEKPNDPFAKLPNGSTRTGDCESCEAKEVILTKCVKIWMCKECIQKDIDAALEYQAPELQEERFRAHKNIENVHLAHVKSENQAIKISTDIFNAKIKAITELKQAIDADESIQNKHFALAQVINQRYENLSQILFGVNQQKAEIENEQKAIQHYYNELSKRLHKEERDKIKLADLDYKPEVVKELKPKEEKARKNFDKTGIAAQVLITGLNETLIQMTCVGRNVAPEMAVKLLNEQGIWGDKQKKS
jgi:ribosomal protein L37AE/L43A